MSQIYLFKDRDIHVGNSGTGRDPWDSFSGAAGWERRELPSRAIRSPMKAEGTALSCKDVWLFCKRGETGQIGM